MIGNDSIAIGEEVDEQILPNTWHRFDITEDNDILKCMNRFDLLSKTIDQNHTTKLSRSYCWRGQYSSNKSQEYVKINHFGDKYLIFNPLNDSSQAISFSKFTLHLKSFSIVRRDRLEVKIFYCGVKCLFMKQKLASRVEAMMDFNNDHNSGYVLLFYINDRPKYCIITTFEDTSVRLPPNH